MHIYGRASVAFLLMLLASAFASGQSSKSEKDVTATIAGRVTLGGKPASGVVVTLLSAEPTFKRAPSVRTTADEEGRYRLTGVAAGRYNVAPIAPALVVPQDTGSWQPGKLVTVSEGEEIEGLNFSLMRGGVITGRITDSQGRPVIDQEVNFLQIDERGQKLASARYTPYGFQTDDRGIYRIYGLAAGRYLVSAGEENDSGSVRFGYGGGFYARTFHPNTTEQSRAAIVEVTAGSETTRIDIVLGVASKSYTASGRIVDADTGKPIANVQFGHGAVKENNLGAFGWSSNRTNANGEFRIEGLTPGRYAAFMITEGESETYSEPAPFEVTSEDIKGLEIKARRGASISGVAVVEGTNDTDALARLSSLQLYPMILNQEGMASPRIMPARIGTDGSFRITGLRSGKVKMRLGGMPNDRKGFSVLRVEREGRVMSDEIEVEAGEQITGVRLVLAYGTSVIRGQVKIEGGELPDDLILIVHVRRPGDETYVGTNSRVDGRRRFALEGLSAGEYEVELAALPASVANAPPTRIAPVKQTVTVPQAGAVEITLTLNLAARDKDN
jgi:hypothetical protein